MKLTTEISQLLDFVTKINQDKNTLYPDHRDAMIFDQVSKKIPLLINELSKLPQRKQKDLRDKIRWQLNRAVFSLYLKTSPRFFIDVNEKMVCDIVSAAWTSDYFRIEPVLCHLNKYIQGKIILDPMAGSGNDMNLVAAFCRPRSIICTDMCYKNGQKVPGTEMHYQPLRNRQEIEKLFTGLPDYYQPHLSKIIQKYEYQNVKKLSFVDKEFDWVITDPPFGINFKPGGFNYFVTLLPELLRVVSCGIIFSSMLDWEKQLERKGFKITNLTGDATKGKSKYPSCYLMIKKY
jgi:hypothetical protein